MSASIDSLIKILKDESGYHAPNYTTGDDTAKHSDDDMEADIPVIEAMKIQSKAKKIKGQGAEAKEGEVNTVTSQEDITKMISSLRVAFLPQIRKAEKDVRSLGLSEDELSDLGYDVGEGELGDSAVSRTIVRKKDKTIDEDVVLVDDAESEERESATLPEPSEVESTDAGLPTSIKGLALKRRKEPRRRKKSDYVEEKLPDGRVVRIKLGKKESRTSLPQYTAADLMEIVDESGQKVSVPKSLPNNPRNVSAETLKPTPLPHNIGVGPDPPADPAVKETGELFNILAGFLPHDPKSIDELERTGRLPKKIANRIRSLWEARELGQKAKDVLSERSQILQDFLTKYPRLFRGTPEAGRKLARDVGIGLGDKLPFRPYPEETKEEYEKRVAAVKEAEKAWHETESHAADIIGQHGEFQGKPITISLADAPSFEVPKRTKAEPYEAYVKRLKQFYADRRVLRESRKKLLGDAQKLDAMRRGILSRHVGPSKLNELIARVQRLADIEGLNWAVSEETGMIVPSYALQPHLLDDGANPYTTAERTRDREIRENDRDYLFGWRKKQVGTQGKGAYVKVKVADGKGGFKEVKMLNTPQARAMMRGEKKKKTALESAAKQEDIDAALDDDFGDIDISGIDIESIEEDYSAEASTVALSDEDMAELGLGLKPDAEIPGLIDDAANEEIQTKSRKKKDPQRTAKRRQTIKQSVSRLKKSFLSLDMDEDDSNALWRYMHSDVRPLYVSATPGTAGATPMPLSAVTSSIHISSQDAGESFWVMRNPEAQPLALPDGKVVMGPAGLPQVQPGAILLLTDVNSENYVPITANVGEYEDAEGKKQHQIIDNKGHPMVPIKDMLDKFQKSTNKTLSALPDDILEEAISNLGLDAEVDTAVLSPAQMERLLLESTRLVREYELEVQAVDSGMPVKVEIPQEFQYIANSTNYIPSAILMKFGIDPKTQGSTTFASLLKSALITKDYKVLNQIKKEFDKVDNAYQKAYFRPSIPRALLPNKRPNETIGLIGSQRMGLEDSVYRAFGGIGSVKDVDMIKHEEGMKLLKQMGVELDIGLQDTPPKVSGPNGNAVQGYYVILRYLNGVPDTEIAGNEPVVARGMNLLELTKNLYDTTTKPSHNKDGTPSGVAPKTIGKKKYSYVFGVLPIGESLHKDAMTRVLLHDLTIYNFEDKQERAAFYESGGYRNPDSPYRKNLKLSPYLTDANMALDVMDREMQRIVDFGNRAYPNDVKSLEKISSLATYLNEALSPIEHDSRITERNGRKIRVEGNWPRVPEYEAAMKRVREIIPLVTQISDPEAAKLGLLFVNNMLNHINYYRFLNETNVKNAEDFMSLPDVYKEQLKAVSKKFVLEGGDRPLADGKSIREKWVAIRDAYRKKHGLDKSIADITMNMVENDNELGPEITIAAIECYVTSLVEAVNEGEISPELLPSYPALIELWSTKAHIRNVDLFEKRVKPILKRSGYLAVTKNNNAKTFNRLSQEERRANIVIGSQLIGPDTTLPYSMFKDRISEASVNRALRKGIAKEASATDRMMAGQNVDTNAARTGASISAKDRDKNHLTQFREAANPKGFGGK